jgi:hypothetical protein
MTTKSSSQYDHNFLTSSFKSKISNLDLSQASFSNALTEISSTKIRHYEEGCFLK